MFIGVGGFAGRVVVNLQTSSTASTRQLQEPRHIVVGGVERETTQVAMPFGFDVAVNLVQRRRSCRSRRVREPGARLAAAARFSRSSIARRCNRDGLVAGRMSNLLG